MPTAAESSRLTRDSLIADYDEYASPEAEWLIGGEFERHLLRPDGSPVPYFGRFGVAWLLDKLASNGGWTRHFEGEHIISLERDGAYVTLEPGSQFELSGRPFKNIKALADETEGFTREVAEALGDSPVHQVALGLTPFARIEDIPWVPKGRYVIMREHLAKTGTLAHHMMKGTAAVQATFDFKDEADCARKVALATRLAPLTVAIFANSPISEGKSNGFMSRRGYIWTQTDPARTGIPDAAGHFSYAAWVDYLLDVPMMFIKRDGRWVSAEGRTFRQWMDDGIDGIYPGRDEWNLHLTSVFPEVRVKHGIEVRSADCVSLPLALGFVALFKGLFYCGKAMTETEAIAERFCREATRDERFAIACRDGLEGRLGDRRMADWAAELVDATRAGLTRCAPEDLEYFGALVSQVERGVSPARDVLAAFEADPTPMGLIEATRFEAPPDA